MVSLLISQLGRRFGGSAEILGADAGLHISTADRGPDKHGGARRESDDAHPQAVCGQHTHAAEEWHHTASKACGGRHKGERLLLKVHSKSRWSYEKCCRALMLHTRFVSRVESSTAQAFTLASIFLSISSCYRHGLSKSWPPAAMGKASSRRHSHTVIVACLQVFVTTFEGPAPPTQAGFFFFGTELLNPCMWSTDSDFSQAPYFPGNGSDAGVCEGCKVQQSCS